MPGLDYPLYLLLSFGLSSISWALACTMSWQFVNGPTSCTTRQSSQMRLNEDAGKFERGKAIESILGLAK